MTMLFSLGLTKVLKAASLASFIYKTIESMLQMQANKSLQGCDESWIYNTSSSTGELHNKLG